MFRETAFAKSYEPKVGCVASLSDEPMKESHQDREYPSPIVVSMSTSTIRCIQVRDGVSRSSGDESMKRDSILDLLDSWSWSLDAETAEKEKDKEM